MNIIQRFIPASNKKTRPGTKMVPKYITIHETDNTSARANAEAHAKLQERGNDRTASWHLTVDENGCYQSVPFDEVAYAAGDGVNGPGNNTSIHIEMCVNSDGDYNQTVCNTVEVVKYLMGRFNIPNSKIVPHKHWSGKNCPRNLLPLWAGFIERCKGVSNGWVYSGGKWFYYLNGTMKTGWIKDKGTWYYLNADGVMLTGWIKDTDKWYFLRQDGAMLTGWQKVNGKWYYLESSGAMKTGWLKDASKWYYLENSGAMVTGWMYIGGKWYFFESSGAMAKGKKIDADITVNADGSISKIE